MGRVPRNDPDARGRRTAAASLPPQEAEGPADAFEPDAEAAEESFFPRWFRAVCRLTGFLLLAGPAVGILAALVLLPEYAAWKNDVYQRDLVAAETADLESLKEAQERLVQATYDDPVQIKRLAMWALNLWPTNEQVLDSLLPPPPPPTQVTIPPHPRPSEPNDAFLRAAAKVSLPPDPHSPEYRERAGTRRGLFVVSAGLLLFAVLLFGPGARRGAGSRRGPAPPAAQGRRAQPEGLARGECPHRSVFTQAR